MPSAMIKTYISYRSRVVLFYLEGNSVKIVRPKRPRIAMPTTPTYVLYTKYNADIIVSVSTIQHSVIKACHVFLLSEATVAADSVTFFLLSSSNTSPKFSKLSGAIKLLK